MSRIRLIWIFLMLVLAATIASAQDGELEGIPATLYQTVNVRTGPDTRYEIVAQVTEGDTVSVIGREGDASRWLQVVLPDGAQGWVPSYFLVFEADPMGLPIVDQEVEAAEASSDVLVTAYGQVNVRSGPGIVHDIIGQLEVDMQARALARSNPHNDWLYIETESLSGWVAYFTVQVQGDPSTLPVRVPDASGQELVAPAMMVAPRFNTVLRAEPALEAPEIGQVPFGSTVMPLARSEASEWLYVAFENTAGWAAVELFDITPESVEELPLYSPDVDYFASATLQAVAPTPEAILEATPEATLEATPEATAAA